MQPKVQESIWHQRRSVWKMSAKCGNVRRNNGSLPAIFTSCSKGSCHPTFHLTRSIWKALSFFARCFLNLLPETRPCSLQQRLRFHFHQTQGSAVETKTIPMNMRISRSKKTALLHWHTGSFPDLFVPSTTACYDDSIRTCSRAAIRCTLSTWP